MKNKWLTILVVIVIILSVSQTALAQQEPVQAVSATATLEFNDVGYYYAPSGNDPPVVIDIPDQTIIDGDNFAAIHLDDFVSDIDHTDVDMIWTYSGNVELTVDITDRVATIHTPSAEWNGSETIIFRATDPDSLYDEDAATFTVNPPPPTLKARPDSDQVEGFQWPLGASVTLNINNVDLDTQTVVVDPNNPAGTYVLFELTASHDLVPSDAVRLTSGTTVKEHTVTALAVTAIDADANTIAGVTDAPFDVQLWVHPGVTGSFVTVPPASGAWTADFNPFDLVAGNAGPAVQYDNDGDCTWIEWNIPTSTLHVVPSYPEVHGHDWQAGADVTIIIDDDLDPANGVLFTQTKNADDDPWCGYPCFDLTGVFSLAVGQYVTMQDDIVSKTVLISPLTVTGIDIDNDTVTGTGDPGAQVAVNIHSQGGIGRWVTVLPEGVWVADFSVVGDEESEQVIADLILGDHGRAIQLNNDGTDDGTLEYWNVPIPSLAARPDSDQVEGFQWPLGASVTLNINNVDLDTQTVVVDPNNPAGTYVLFDLTASHDLVPGDAVRLTSGTTVKEHTVTALAVTAIDADANTIAGVTDASFDVQLWVHPGITGSFVTAPPASGAWTADFNPFDLVAGNAGPAVQCDNDGDCTWIEWNIPTTVTQVISLNAGWNLITLPLQPLTHYDAETLLQAINAQGCACTEIDRWANGMWESYPLGMPFGQFPIDLAQGYFVRCTAPGSWTMEGMELTGSVSLNLLAGWNLIGIPYPASGNSAMSIVNGINNQGGVCTELVRWRNGAWEAYVDSVPFTDFAILPTEGYFVKCTAPSTYAP